MGIQIGREEDLVPHYDAKSAAEGRYIFVHDDDVSTMVDVVRWLERVFDMDERAAALKMVGIHRHGHGVLGPFDPGEAESRMQRGRATAAELGLSTLVFSRDPPS